MDTEATEALEGRPYDLLSFAEARRNRFQGGTEFDVLLCSYLEQLALQTSTNIDEWTLGVFRNLTSWGSLPLDKRAVNKVFFEEKEKRTHTIEALSISAEAALQETKVKASETVKVRLTHLQETYKSQLTEATRTQVAADAYLKKAWEVKKEMYALKDRGANYIMDEAKKLLAEGFWEFHDYGNSILRFRTKNDVVMSEINKAAGIDRRVTLGKYLAEYRVNDASLKLKRFTQNAISHGYYHPYCNNSGAICWGNAANTASKLLSQGELYAVFNLLASLLVTYSPDASPYENLAGFALQKKRFDAKDDVRSNDDDEDLCDWCEQHTDDCDCCHTCETTRDECHCCSICDGDSNDCGCCHECENVRDECEGCPICGNHNDDCGCCDICGLSKRGLTREGHSNPSCPSREPVEEAPTPAENALPPEPEDHPF